MKLIQYQGLFLQFIMSAIHTYLIILILLINMNTIEAAVCSLPNL